jgi:hypothetical protein
MTVMLSVAKHPRAKRSAASLPHRGCVELPTSNAIAPSAASPGDFAALSRHAKSVRGPE